MRMLVAVISMAIAGPAFAASPDPAILAGVIDAHLTGKLKANGVTPAPVADDAEYLRRVYLDLTGRIPRSNDVRQFLIDTDPNKRRKLIDDLLETPQFASHFANVWRAFLIPETIASGEARIFQPGFEAWLRGQFRENRPYDQTVIELLTPPISSDPKLPTATMRKPGDASPMAFIAVKEAKPENLAAAVTRCFLGLQLECAQCHDHPFSTWTRDQFWNQAAFFAGIEKHGNGLFAPISEATDRRELKVALTNRTAPALYLDDATPDWKSGKPARLLLAEWIASKQNPFFAKATVNRLWGHFFGLGIVEPVDDFHDQNPPSHPALLADLAKAFADANFDLQYLVRAICSTQAYQRTSRQTEPNQANPRLFSRMTVKGLTGEQFYDSLVLATGSRESERNPARDRFLTQFALQGKPSEPATSVPQALALMNGTFINDATTLNKSPTLIAIRDLPGLDTTGQVEALFLVALSRKPTEKERTRLVGFIDDAGTGQKPDRLADAFWILLNLAEFRLNH